MLLYTMMWKYRYHPPQQSNIMRSNLTPTFVCILYYGSLDDYGTGNPCCLLGALLIRIHENGSISIWSVSALGNLDIFHCLRRNIGLRRYTIGEAFFQRRWRITHKFGTSRHIWSCRHRILNTLYTISYFHMLNDYENFFFFSAPVWRKEECPTYQPMDPDEYWLLIAVRLLSVVFWQLCIIHTQNKTFSSTLIHRSSLLKRLETRFSCKQ